MKTSHISEAADFLKVDRTTALQSAAEGGLPGAKIGRAWVFLEDEAVSYLRGHKGRYGVVQSLRSMIDFLEAEVGIEPA